jgi:hypothetical protein
MKLEYGDMSSPTGNAIIFWVIKGNNRLLRDSEIVASNFVISPLQFNNETLMVNFPPVLLDNLEELLKIAETRGIDLIRGGEIFVPEDITDFNKFYRKQINKYNGIIQDYLLAYKEKNNMDTDGKSLPRLISEAGEIMEDVRHLVKNKEKKGLINVKIQELREIQENMNSEMPGFDLGRIIRYIDKPDSVIDSLVYLYTQKFLAIFLEDYEKAHLLKKQINKIEKSLAR